MFWLPYRVYCWITYKLNSTVKIIHSICPSKCISEYLSYVHMYIHTYILTSVLKRTTTKSLLLTLRLMSLMHEFCFMRTRIINLYFTHTSAKSFYLFLWESILEIFLFVYQHYCLYSTNKIYIKIQDHMFVTEDCLTN